MPSVEMKGRSTDSLSKLKEENTYLTSFVNHIRFDVNRACHKYRTYPTGNFPCLFVALASLDNCFGNFEKDYGPFDNEDPDFTTESDLTEADSEILNRYIDAIKILLEAGANPTQTVLENPNRSGIGLIENWLRALQKDVGAGHPTIRLLKGRVYRQLLTMMREASRVMPLW